jgi:hypothetical protein
MCDFMADACVDAAHTLKLPFVVAMPTLMPGGGRGRVWFLFLRSVCVARTAQPTPLHAVRAHAYNTAPHTHMSVLHLL